MYQSYYSHILSSAAQYNNIRHIYTAYMALINSINNDDSNKFHHDQVQFISEAIPND